jgi:NodT family efflux transporter outer membrane factor (OMF) lipoprotein
MRMRKKLLAIAVAGTLSACALQSPPESRDNLPQALPGVVVPDRFGSEALESGSVAGGWAATFADPRLDALIAEAVGHNPDLLVAAARVESAAQYVELAESKLFPQVNALARGGGEMSGDQSGLSGGGIFADWEVDLWGHVRAAKAANVATYEATVADTEYARQSIAAMVAKSYFLAVEARLQQSLAEEMEAASEQLVMLAGERQRIGRGDGLDAALSRANTETFRDAVLQLSLAREQALRALEALLGRYPAASVDIAAELAKAPAPVPAGLPSELLERRPDVIAADRRVAAAFYRIKEAKAARLPTLSLTASVNTISSDLFVLQDRENPVWSAGASLLAPLYNGRGLKTQVQIRTAEQRQAVAEYGRVGARAFGEVENALSAELNAGRREEVLTRATAANQEALVLARTRYDVGSGDLRAVQQQQVAVHGSRATLVRVQTDRLVQRVNLYLALGGGFDAPSR